MIASTDAFTKRIRHVAKTSRIYTGIGGWTFAPWRGVFFPKGLPHARELEYAATHVTSIEVNGTFYRTQSPATFHKWAQSVPDSFVFSIKGPRFVVQKRVLAEAGESVMRFLDSGVTELGDRLGPLLWTFAPTKKFDADDIAAFLALLPHKHNGVALRHAIEVRHDSFLTPDFIALLRKNNATPVFSEHDTYPAIADITSDFVYARLQKGDDKIETGYPPKALKAWAVRAQVWAGGGMPDDLPRVDENAAVKKVPRDVFLYVIHEGKVRAPAAAMALIAELT
jgi:uncharacterized protein YecE (DUF72 family)